jgi:hypothetical protein
VCGWSAADTAAILDMSSAMRRARATLWQHAGSEGPGGRSIAYAAPRALLDRYVHACESKDSTASSLSWKKTRC